MVMYPFRSLNVPLGVHVHQFGNAWPKTIKNCHEKLITPGSVADTRRSGGPPTSRDLEVVQVVQEMFARCPKKSIRKAARESKLSFHCLQNVHKNLIKNLNNGSPNFVTCS